MSQPDDHVTRDERFPRWDEHDQPTFGEAPTAPLADNRTPLPQQPQPPTSPLLDQPIKLRLGDGRHLEFDGVGITIRSDRRDAKDRGQEMVPLRHVAAIAIDYNDQNGNDKNPQLRIELATGRTRTVEFGDGFRREAEQFQRAASKGIALLDAGHVPTPEVSRQVAEEMRPRRSFNWPAAIMLAMLFLAIYWALAQR